ncbi:MAG TPA: Hsp20/alpha crystallin family protein [Deinococcales bacterium]|nr:Hsp20/alpha crystallin family protein [Deinococcales bacterium]
MLRQTTSLSPWQLLDDMRERLERGFSSDASSNAFPLDVLEENDHLLVRVNLPGVDAGSVQLSLENNTLTLTAKLAEDGEAKRYLYRERPVGTVRRAITLPVRLNPEQTEANLENGVLVVRVAKAPEATARRINVQVGGQNRTIEAGQGG